MKKIILLFVTTLVLMASFTGTPVQAAVKNNITFRFCPSINSGQLDGYYFGTAKLAIYGPSGSTPIQTLEMVGPNKDGGYDSPCYFGFEGMTDSIDTSISPATFVFEVAVYPPGAATGNAAKQYASATDTSTTVFQSLENDGFYQFTGQLSNAGLKDISTSKLLLSEGKSVSGYRLFPDLSCETSSQPLSCFTKAVFGFAQTAIIVLAVAAIVIAGVIYMTSAGNPKQIETAKKLIIGALTGVAVMVLGRLFLTKVIGVPWPL